MKNFASFLGGIALSASAATARSIPRYFSGLGMTNAVLDPNVIAAELGAECAEGTLIFGPNNPEYVGAASRWNPYAKPDFQVVVVPTNEEDVSTIVKYCHENGIEFLVNNSGHGFPSSLSNFAGLMISVKELRGIEITESGESAWFGGGVLAREVTDYLWERGYVTTTPACDCIGVVGPGLGGGHGRFEGLHGLVSDNFLNINLVLGDGTPIRVNSTSHPDLFWALQGAGHNFGVVTSVEMNIFPRGPEYWHYHNYIWKGEQLERVFEELNRFHNNGTTPVDMLINVGNFIINKDISETEPIIAWTFAYRGSAQEAEALLSPFNRIPNEQEAIGDVPYPEISTIQETSPDSFICRHGDTRITSPAMLQTYNVTSERKIFNSFQRIIDTNPGLASGAAILHDGYSTNAVWNGVDDDASAYPFRFEHHLLQFNTVVQPGYEDAAWEWAREVQGYWRGGQASRPNNIYVNYAHGGETPRDWYGVAEWRQEKLQRVKEQYDPDNCFRYYNPITA